MAFDPTYQDITEQFGQSYFFQEMKGQTEREIKLCVKSDPNVIVLPNQANNFSIQRGALAIKALFADLEQHGIWHDPRGIIPNNYILASLNMDTADGSTPTAKFYSNGWQVRKRFPLPVQGQDNPFDYIQMLGHRDANMKTFLSNDALAHRTELEEVVSAGPTKFFRDFKKATKLPLFTRRIRDHHLRVTDICLTSRTGFYVIMKDPQSDAHVLLHGTYDASRFVASDVFTDKSPRLEIELEAKGIFTKNNDHLTSEQQDVIVDRVFNTVFAAAAKHGLTPFNLSKIEDSMAHADAHYKNTVGDLNQFAQRLDRNNIPYIRTLNHMKRSEADGSEVIVPSLYRLYAIAAGNRISEIFNTLKNKGDYAPITVLAREMPDPKNMLDSLLQAPHRAIA